MTTTPTLEIRPRPIRPLGVTTGMAPLAGISGVHRPKNNTVVFASGLHPIQPVTVNPGTERSPHSFIQAASDFRFVVQVAQFLNHDQPQVGVSSYVPSNLIHPLFESLTGCLLPFGAVLAPLDPVDVGLDVRAQMPSVRETGKGLDARVHPEIDPHSSLLSRIHLKSERDGPRRDDVAVQSLASGCKAIEVPMPLDGEVDADL